MSLEAKWDLKACLNGRLGPSLISTRCALSGRHDMKLVVICLFVSQKLKILTRCNDELRIRRFVCIIIVICRSLTLTSADLKIAKEPKGSIYLQFPGMATIASRKPTFGMH